MTNDEKIIGTFCDKCRNPFCTCKPNKTHQLVMLPTEKPLIIGHIIKCIIPMRNEIAGQLGISMVNKDYTGEIEYYKAQHLYILSDEPIKIGDWVIWFGKYNLPFLKKVIGERQDEWLLSSTYDMWVEKNKPKKIIAATDSSLEIWREEYTGIPPRKAKVNFPNEQLYKISKQFIQYFIKQYNKGNIINEVEVDFHENCKFKYYKSGISNKMIAEKYDINYTLKIDKENCISILIKEEEKLYTKDEVEKLCTNSYLEGLNYGVSRTRNPDHYVYVDSPLVKWIEENLK